MSIQKNDTVEILNQLIDICREGCSLFALASGAVAAPELSRHLTRFARERLVFVGDLVMCVRRLGGEVVSNRKAATLRGIRGFLNHDAANDPRAVLSGCEWGDEDALERYRDAMTKIDDPNVRELVTEQFVSVKVARDTLRALRELVSRRERPTEAPLHDDTFAPA